jgi:hypothetical protein
MGGAATTYTGANRMYFRSAANVVLQNVPIGLEGLILDLTLDCGAEPAETGDALRSSSQRFIGAAPGELSPGPGSCARLEPDPWPAFRLWLPSPPAPRPLPQENSAHSQSSPGHIAAGPRVKLRDRVQAPGHQGPSCGTPTLLEPCGTPTCWLCGTDPPALRWQRLQAMLCGTPTLLEPTREHSGTPTLLAPQGWVSNRREATPGQPLCATRSRALSYQGVTTTSGHPLQSSAKLRDTHIA